MRCVKGIGVVAGVAAVLAFPSFGQDYKVVDKEDLVERGGLFYEMDSDTPFTGKTVSFYPDGQIKTEGEFRDGKSNGLFILWFDDGQKHMEEEYWDGREEWRLTQWYRNGQKFSEGMLKKGASTCQGELQSIGVGTWTFWHSNGQIKKQGEFRDGKKEGKWKAWYANGQKAEEAEYWDDAEVSRIEWDTNGNPIQPPQPQPSPSPIR